MSRLISRTLERNLSTLLSATQRTNTNHLLKLRRSFQGFAPTVELSHGVRSGRTFLNCDLGLSIYLFSVPSAFCPSSFSNSRYISIQTNQFSLLFCLLSSFNSFLISFMLSWTLIFENLMMRILSFSSS